MMHLKWPYKFKKIVNVSRIGPNEKCEVPKDPTYPLCTEKVEVRTWK